MHTIEFDNEVEELLENVAHSQGLEIDAVIKNAVAEYVEDILDTLAGEAALEELENGEDDTISFDDWKKQHYGVAN
jgi:predicted DNA-binding protein